MRASWRHTPLVLLSLTVFLTLLVAGESAKGKRQTQPIDDENSDARQNIDHRDRQDHRGRHDPRYRERQELQDRYDPRDRSDTLRTAQDWRQHPGRGQDPRLRQDPYRQSRIHRPDAYGVRYQERTAPPTRRPETARYDPRSEARRQIFTDFDKIVDEKGNWSEWDTSAPCSRSCGGGVTFKQRTCLEESCNGPTRIYSTCNKHDCPKNETQESFLLKQCQRMNSIPVDDRYYSWTIRRRHDRNPCELNCSPRNRDIELRSRQNVIDGTRCYHAGFDQCVDGQCVPTGCDGLLGSRKRIDKCLVCGGENQNCKTTIHNETQTQLPNGYFPMVVIPKGATSIFVRETHLTSNYIALKTLNGTYLLNKHFEIDSSKAFIAAGSRFHYTRTPQYEGGREFLQAEGPTNETLVVALLVQEINRGFVVEFSLKEIPGQPLARSGEFQWMKGEWEPCVDPCGEQNTTRSVRCASIISNRDAVNIEECDEAERPPSRKTCPVNNCASEWYAGNWERCSNTCGNGTQTRTVFCSVAAGEGVRVLPDRLCKGKGERPAGEQECSSNESCDKWETGDWSETEKKCGVTKQIREVKCSRQLENSTEGVELENLDCLEDLKPEVEQEVFLEPCTGVEWAFSEWSPCSGCGSAIRTRKVECVNEEGRVYKDEFCSGKPKPENESACTDAPICEHRWFTSEWSPCSVSCGSGVQSRVVFCGKLDENSTMATKVEETNCEGEAPVDKQTCEKENCKHLWLAGPWNKECPENACGGVPLKRKVFCYTDGVKAEDCPEDSKPKETDDCNAQACPADMISVLGDCVGTEHGCCPDGVTTAGSEFKGCPSLDRENITTPCASSHWGCCRDLVTPAFGPFQAGCSVFALCNGTDFGCCQDQTSNAEGPNYQGCVVPCDLTDFGCCHDGLTAAVDEQLSNCVNKTEVVEADDEPVISLEPVLGGDVGSGSSGEGELEGSGEEPLLESKCAESEHGCCPDKILPALDAEKRKGCVHCRAHKHGCCPDGITAALGRKFKGCEDACTNSTFGCCPDGFFPAKGADKLGCDLVDCKDSKYGCCGKLKIPALGPMKEGCQNCTESAYGCCANNEDFALGPNGAGCCADAQFGCCPDNKTLAQGPDLAGCPCSTLEFGCCPDKLTPALGPKLYGCTCENSEFGCCSDLITPALGPAQANCTCDRTAFGCCPDGVQVALGPDTRRSCDCRIAQYGCCPDGRTPATGPSHRGCHCSSMKYGCCSDNKTPAAGPNGLGCPCHATIYGCCLDGVTKKLGRYNEGCEDCTKLKYGCCPDGNQAARGPDMQGCPCESTEFGCCPDRVTASKGKDNEGCPKVPCHLTTYGCCPDRTAATGHHMEGCNLTPEERKRYDDHRRQLEQRRHPGEHVVPTRPPYYEPKRSREACFQIRDRGPCGNWSLVYSYSAQNATCEMFYYGGCGGNDNRFPDKDTCMTWCGNDSPPIPKTEDVPPVDTNEVIPQTRRTSRFPCDLPKDSGPCRGQAERYWFNEASNRCERFLYGCQGNDNRFETYKACSERCKVLSDVERCTLPKVVTTNCTDQQTLFRYNYKSRMCEPYKGCTEDVNVFRDYNNCVSTCQNIGRSTDLAATVCAMPKEGGPCSTFTPMWAYVDGICTPFYYGGCEGNANRFSSHDECQQFCHPQSPQYPTHQPGHNVTSRLSTSVHLCEQPRETGPCRNFEPRFYFDSASKTCYSFQYGGCGGNQNNFASIEDCQRQCAYQHGDFVPHQPRSSTFNVKDCQLPKDRGTCSGGSAMFYYNPADGVCREFTYSGCGGNNNRFTTRNECDRSCKNAQDRCNLPTVKGRCGGSYKMWTYDAQKDICKQFDFSGCQGNANRFDSNVECEQKCVRGTLKVEGAVSEFPDKCRLASDPGGCAHNLQKYFFDLRLGKCLPFLWGGCEGNDNRFETFNECQKACTVPAIRANLISANQENAVEEFEVPLDKNEICSQPPKSGRSDCAGAQTSIRFYFDDSSKRCLQFTYYGCDGNKNNFVTLEKCNSFCVGSHRARQEETPVFRGIDPRRPSTFESSCPPDNCGTLTCHGLGERRETLPNGCTRCICNHPCDGVQCASDEKCAVKVDLGTYFGICRPQNKSGECPKVTCDENQRGRSMCIDDSACEGLKKCCNSGCNMVCVDPKAETKEDVEEIAAVEGKLAKLVCPIDADDETVSWTKDGVELEGERFDQDGETLMILAVRKEDAGVYHCAQYDLPENNGKIALRIAAAPKIIKENPVVESRLNTTANLSCTVMGGYPRPSIIWSRNETRLPSRSNKYRQQPGNTLQIIDVDKEDQDLYICTASNDQGRAQFMVALIIPLQGSEDHQSKGQDLAQKARADAVKP